MCAFFLFYLKKDVYWENTVSLWFGTVAFLFNVCVRSFAPEQLSWIEWTRPFCEVVCIAGTLMTVMIILRMPDALPWALHVFSVFGHIAVGASAYGVAFTFLGTLVCFSVLLASLLVYWVLEVTVGGAWPYPLAPVEVGALIVCFLGLRLL